MDRSSWEQEPPAAIDAEQFSDIVESVPIADADDYDAVLVGEPYDRGTVTRRGARDGPVAVRAALSAVATHHLDAGPVDAVGDLGSVEIPFGASVATAREAVRGTVDEVHDSDAVPIILGGDSSLTVANVAGLLGTETAADGGYASDGGERTDGPRTSSELRSDGGFDDDESVGDVEHFDPAGGSVDEDADEQGTEETDATESEDAEPPEDTTAEAADDDDETQGESEEETDADEETESTDSDDEETAEEDADATSEDTDGGDSAEQTDDTDDAGSEEVVEDSTVGETGFGTSGESATDVVEETTVETTATAETGAVGVIRLGARLDCQPVDSEPTNRSVGRQLLDAGVDSLAVVGARHFESTTAEAEYLRDNGGTVVTAEEVGDDAVEAADRALGTVEDADQVYVSIDLSVLDATAAPGVSDPAPGGLQSRELFRLVRLLASDDRLAGLELVETAPTHDRDGQTVDAAARTVAHALAALQA